jgi:hypothetical protein
MLKAGGYRSVANYIDRARDEHIALGFAWDDQLKWVARKCVRAVSRGIGPSRQSCALPFMQLMSLGLPEAPLVDGGPVGGRAVFAAGCLFLAREIELSLAVVGNVVFNTEMLTVSWRLPADKTDPAGLGKTRSWSCCCSANGAQTVCVYHALFDHFVLLRQKFGGDGGKLASDLPLFPTVRGTAVAKVDMVKCIERAAVLCGEPLVDSLGSRRYGGHSLRVTGAQYLASVGVPLLTIQLLGRWASDIIARYVAEAPLCALPLNTGSR